MKSVKTVLTLALLLSAAAACNRAQNEQTSAAVANAPSGKSIVGRWQEAQNRENIEFTSDGHYHGQMLSGMNQVLSPVSGTYFTANDSISLTPENSKYPMTWKFQFLDNSDLVLTFVQGGETKIDGTMAKFRKAS
jgi:hypothetical protein